MLLDWMLPRVCAACEQPLHSALARGADEPARGWCPGCAASLPGLAAARCPRCGERDERGERADHGERDIASCSTECCLRCSTAPPAFDRTIVLADYAMPLDHLVQAIKFGGQAALAAPLGGLLARAALLDSAGDPASRPDTITAVPLTAARLAGRGFNQALLLAGPVARAYGLKTAPLLLRRCHEGAPASSLGASQRRSTLAHAFVAQGVRAGATVLVVDDVMTTGATLQAAASALKAAGAARVVNCVVARTQAPDARPQPASPAPGATAGL
jgi:ComF family protein